MEIILNHKEHITFREIFNDNYINIHLYSYQNPELGIVLRKNKKADMYITYMLKNKKIKRNYCQPMNPIYKRNLELDEQIKKNINNYLIKIDIKNIMINLQKR